MNVDIGFDETQYGKLAKSDFTHLIALLIGARNDGMNLYVGTYFTSLLTAILVRNCIHTRSEPIIY